MNIEKLVWTDEDFEKMGWHDCKIYAIAFNDEKFELSFDIDYIFKWISPEKENYSFLLSPTTLIFRNVYDINMTAYALDMEIQEISRTNPTIPKNVKYLDDNSMEYDWRIETNNGEITFKSIGYRQIVRKQPELFHRQSIGMIERGGIVFDTIIEE
ncbi:MAG TPA: hypothetical protein VGM63_01965 [Mucilaginibacter sp.]|jgi:hypothetical protein